MVPRTLDWHLLVDVSRKQFGMSATVDIECMAKQVRNKNAILLGTFCQFILLPFLGFAVVNLLQLEAPLGITLLVVTSSPGGSYSNW